jgi:hypothetical protein
MAQQLGVLQLLIPMSPLVLPIQGERAQGQHAYAKACKCAVGGSMEACKPGGLAFNSTGRQRGLQQFQRLALGSLGSAAGLAGLAAWLEL